MIMFVTSLQSFARYLPLEMNSAWVMESGSANALDPVETDQPQANEPSSSRRSKPDQFCIHRVDGDTSTLLTTVEYKPPHKRREPSGWIATDGFLG